MPRPDARAASYALKVALADPRAAAFDFPGQKTMYGGRRVAAGDEVFVFDSENAGGAGLVARGVVESVRAVPTRPGLARQTPRVDLRVQRLAAVRQRLGRAELKPFAEWHDGRPETELNFKLYRQATDKLVGLSAAAADFLRAHVEPVPESP